MEPAPAVPDAIVGTGFTYQGQLQREGRVVNDVCAMAFRLYDQDSGGNQVGNVIVKAENILVGSVDTRSMRTA